MLLYIYSTENHINHNVAFFIPVFKNPCSLYNSLQRRRPQGFITRFLGEETRDEPLRTSAWEASLITASRKHEHITPILSIYIGSLCT